MMFFKKRFNQKTTKRLRPVEASQNYGNDEKHICFITPSAQLDEDVDIEPDELDQDIHIK